MKNVLAVAALAAAAFAGTVPASAVGACLPETPAAEGCASVSYFPGHLCVYANLTVAGVPVVSQPCR
jgi:hypothetical protein